MATLIDHKTKRITKGTAESLQSLMVTAQLRKVPRGVAAKARYAETSVRAAIRRGGRTDAGQELRMSDDERAQWERDNPLPQEG